jgi:hypothetical protein
MGNRISGSDIEFVHKKGYNDAISKASYPGYRDYEYQNSLSKELQIVYDGGLSKGRLEIIMQKLQT